MKQRLTFSAALVASALLLAGCTQGSGTQPEQSPSPEPKVVTADGAITYSNDVKGAAMALQDMLVNLDAEMDASYTGSEKAAATDAAKYDLLKAQLPRTSSALDTSLDAQKGAKLLETYGSYLKLVSAENKVSVEPFELKMGEDGKVTIDSSALRVNFDNKPRVIDRTGESSVVLTYDGSKWKVSDANTVWAPVLK